jgi:hypothetical protein
MNQSNAAVITRRRLLFNESELDRHTCAAVDQLRTKTL